MEDHIEYEREVRLGIALLEAQAPKGWRAKLDLRSLDMRFVETCVLGQLYPSYEMARRLLGLMTLKQVVAAGFECPEFITDDEQFIANQWAALTAEWRRQLAPSSWLTRLKNFICGKEGCRT